MSSDIQTVTSMLRDVVEHIAQRPDNTALAENMVRSVAQQVRLVPNWRAAHATALDAQLNDAPIDDSLKALVRTASGECPAAAYSQFEERGVGAWPQAVGIKFQKLRCINNYLTKDDYAIVDNPKTDSATRDRVCALRLKAIGVKIAADDGLIKWAITHMLITEQKLWQSWPSYQSTYNRVNVHTNWKAYF